MSEKIFSDEPLNIDRDFDEWEPPPEFAPPPEAGNYSTYLSEIREEDEYEITQPDGVKSKRLRATVDMRIIGGEFDDRAITWQRVTNGEYVRKSDQKRTSMMMDLVRSAGVSQTPNSNAQFSKALHYLKDQGPAAMFKTQIDWRGFCVNCYERKLMEMTGAGSPQEAKDRAGSDGVKEASAFATKAKNARAFPQGAGGRRKDSLICPECGQEVRAQVRVIRFYK